MEEEAATWSAGLGKLLLEDRLASLVGWQRTVKRAPQR